MIVEKQFKESQNQYELEKVMQIVICTIWLDHGADQDAELFRHVETLWY